MKTEKATLREDKRAVSPVIGVILMVAITVILAAVIAAFVFGIGPSSKATPSVQLRATYHADNNTLELKHMGGDPIDLDECSVSVKIAATTTSCTTFADSLTVGISEFRSCGSAEEGNAVTVEVIHTPSQSYVLDTLITAQ